jgi:uncharacterized protein with NRDE domain
VCLVALAWRVHADLPLVIVANRDEMHARPTAPMDWWSAPRLLAGRDLEAGGTWFAVDGRGRFGVVTNVRGRPAPAGAPSRGTLLPRFVGGDEPPLAFLAAIAAECGRYAGFNLLVGDATGLACLSNADDRGPRALGAGVHALSNGPPDARWPKVRHAGERLASALAAGADDDALLGVLAGRQRAPDDELPDTGIGLALERALSPPFIVQPQYGTRSTTVLAAGPGGGRVLERAYDTAGRPLATRRFDLPIAP